MKKLIIMICIPLLLAGCGSNNSSTHHISYADIDEYFEDESWDESVHVKYSENELEEPEYDIHTPLQYAYVMSDFNCAKDYANGKKELSKPRAIRLIADEENYNFDYYYFELSESPSFKDSRIYVSDYNEVEIKNLKIGTKYYYRYNTESIELRNSKTYEFTTNDSPIRNIDVDGITNVRDLGGRKSQLGGKVRQGLYYRGGRLNWSDESTPAGQHSTFRAELTDDGYETMVYDLGIRNEIDLRMNESHYSGNLSHEFGMITNDTFEDIEYNPFPIDYNSNNIMLTEKKTIGNIFKFLSEEESYPVYLHCNIGTDRTGMITLVLGCLIGMNMEDIYRDYLFSNFGNIGSSRALTDIKTKYLKTLQDFKKENLYFDARAYLKDCGVNDDELDNIVKIFLDLEV